MTTITFDTLKASRNLRAAGFDDAQADAIIGMMGDAFTDTVATKADIAEVKAAIATLEARLTKHIYGVVLAGVGLTVTLVKLIP